MFTTIALSLLTALSVNTARLEVKDATCYITPDKAGNYIEFTDKSGGWYLDADPVHGLFEDGRNMRLYIDNKGTSDISDDVLIMIEII